MDIMKAFSSETIMSFWDMFFLPMICAGFTWLLFRAFWKEKLVVCQQWLLRVYNGGGKPDSNSINKVLVVFGGLLFIYTYGKLFSIVGAMLPGFVEVSQSGLLIHMNTMDSDSYTLPKLWAYYDSIDDIDRFAKIVIHNVSVLAAEINTSYYAVQYAAMREEVLSLTAICAEIRMLVVVAMLFGMLSCWDLIRCWVKYGHDELSVCKRVMGVLRILFERIFLLLLILSVLLLCLSISTCNLMETLCEQAKNRCEFLLTFLEADGEVPDQEKLDHAKDMVFRAKDSERAVPVGIEQNGMTGLMWRLCTPIHGLYPNMQRLLNAVPSGESTPDMEQTPEDGQALPAPKADVKDRWELET